MDLPSNIDSVLAQPEPLSTWATRFGRPLNDNNLRRYKRREKTSADNKNKKVPARESDCRRTTVACSNIDYRSLFEISLVL